MNPWRQQLKWAVYTLLFADFILYLARDIDAARHTLDAQSNLLEILAAYVASIDLVAWFVLILLFELETYVLAGRPWPRMSKWIVRAVRVACYVTILHTSFSYDVALREFQSPARLPAAANACAYTEGWTFLRNRDYLEIDAENCETVGTGPEFFALGDDTVLTDRAGLREGLVLAWTDLVESISWQLVVLATEIVVRLKHTASAEARLAQMLEHLKVGLYAVIVAIACYWGWTGQVLYLWDELLWVIGFRVIDGNIRGWRAWAVTMSM